MKRRLLLFFIPFILNCSNAQNILSGVVKNSENSSRVEGTEIFITEFQRGTVSDSNGYYKFSNVPDGNLHIQFNHLGF